MPPEPPDKTNPPDDWPHLKLWERVNALFYALPNHFKTELVVKGINVTEVFSVGGAFATVVETQVVAILNSLRNLWDPDNEYPSYAFIRQSQTFPDVLLKNLQDELEEGQDKILFGIELKSWYVLSKEGEPSFRFQVTPEACAPADLLVIVPWILSDVISGTPKLLTPYREGAKYAAEYRNYYWQKSREERGEPSGITHPPEAQCHPYPASKEEASDEAEGDKGGNFGRIARAEILDEYVGNIKAQDYLGVKIIHWIAFFKAISETSTDEQIDRRIAALRRKIQKDPAYAGEDEEKTQYKQLFLELLVRLEDVWDRTPE
jgi:hypothetical protein